MTSSEACKTLTKGYQDPVAVCIFAYCLVACDPCVDVGAIFGHCGLLCRLQRLLRGGPHIVHVVEFVCLALPLAITTDTDGSSSELLEHDWKGAALAVSIDKW